MKLSLFKPTQSVLTVCEETEKWFQRMLITTKNLPHCKGVTDAIATAVLESINASKTFSELDNHMIDTAINKNHTFKLTKLMLLQNATAKLDCIIWERKLQRELVVRKLERSSTNWYYSNII